MLSILIPTYNYNVDALVKALIYQSLRCKIDFEILIGDDFSSQTICDVSKIRKSEFVQVYRSEISFGRTKTRKLLSSKAKYKWLLFIDSDMLPNDQNYIENYANAVAEYTEIKAFFGGYSYSKNYPNKERLRFRYGKKREFKSAAERCINPYRNIYSGNMLISKTAFEQLNIVLENRYGLDLALSRELEIQKISFKHLDNYTLHMGIEDNSTFLLKSKEASQTMRSLYEKNLISSKQSKLVRAYKLIDKLGLVKLIELKGWLLNPLVCWLLINFKSPLIALDLYKFYHFCKN
jgi:hypothetical protein